MLTYTAAAKSIRALGLTVSREDGEIRVAFKGNESAAYYTDCPEDALATAQHMASVPAPAKDYEGKARDDGYAICEWKRGEEKFVARHIESGEYAFGPSMEKAIANLKREMRG